MPSVSLDTSGFNEAVRGVENVLTVIERRTVFVNAVKAVGKIVQKAAREFVRQPGYPGDKPGLKPLKMTIGVRAREYDSAVMSITGPQWPAGAHGHNVEFGHRIVLRDGTAKGYTTPAMYMARAVAATEGGLDAEFDRAVGPAIEKHFVAG